MDDVTKIPNLNPQIPTGSIASTGSTPPTVSTAPTPVGGIHKEVGPMGGTEAPVAEVLQQSESVPNLEQEVVEAGVEVSKNHELPDLTMHDRNAGLSEAPVIAPVPTQPSGVVAIDTTEEQARDEVKANKNPKKSKSWLVIEIFKMVQRKLLGGQE